MSRMLPVFITLSKETSQNPPLAPVRYDIALSTFPDRHCVDVRVSLVAKALSGSGPVIRMYLGIPGMNVFHIRAVKIDRMPAVYGYRSPSLDIRLPSPLEPGGTVRVDLSYRGRVSSPKNYTGARGTELMGEGLWLPTVCFPGPKFDVNMVTEVPEEEATAAPGYPASTRTRAGRTVTAWRSEVPVMSITFVSAPFSVRNGAAGNVEVQTMVQKGYESSANDLLRTATSVLRTGEDWFGPLPLRRVYLVQPRRVEFGEYAHMPFIVYTKKNLAKVPTDSSRMWLFEATAHELGHFWWGNMVASDSVNEGWLSEGFADFTKVLALEEAFGRQEAVRMLTRMCEVMKQQGHVPPLAVIDMSHPKQTQTVRRKGGLFLEAVRERWGDPSTKTLLRRIYRDFSGRSMNTRDFVAIAEASLPGPGMDVFLRTHLYGTPEYEMDGGLVVAK